ncbi:MAG: zinc transporter [Deltaproteobacteria bacterium]|nr:zinc transporter [Deltaproteobacteria bacterium]
MFAEFEQFHPVLQALLATLFTWGGTALGAALVFFVKQVKARVMDSMLGFAAGAMIFGVVVELIPESQRTEKNIDVVTMFAMIGFSVMMILDAALG